MKLNIPLEYSNVTGLRYSSKSDFSGEDFYHRILNPVFSEAFSRNEKLELILDGSRDGYGPSFLDESIGNLVYDFSLEVVKRHLVVVSEREKLWLDMIEDETYIEWEERRVKGEEPKVTVKHRAWNRLLNGELEHKIWIEPK